MTILVTGGAGYIGAHVVRLLARSGHDVLVVDDLSTGSRARVDGADLLPLDVADGDAVATLTQAMRDRRVTQVIHLAGRKRVDESMTRPVWYFQQNVGGLANVISAMEAAGADQLVFSSSAAVYGDASGAPVGESATTLPVNPYGETKLAGEWLVRAAARAGILRGTSLRYFNVAGSGWQDLGDTTTHNLVTIALDRLTRGISPAIFGTDYATPDGSCVRDYVHVHDLALAHVAAIERPGRSADGYRALNVGTGVGASVLEVLTRLARITGIRSAPMLGARRPGDPAQVVASVGLIRDELGWRAASDLEEILVSAWDSWRSRPGRVA